MNTTAEVEAAFQLLGFIFEADDLIEFRTLGRVVSSRWSTLNEAAAKIEELAGLGSGVQIYFGANPRSRQGGKAEDVKLARCLFADFDGGTTVEQARLRWRDACIPEPTVIVTTGGGLHAWWRLLEPMTDMAEWTLRQKALARRLGADQSCTDAPRIMRLPGFVNWKYPHRPLCVVESCEPDNAFSLEEFPTRLEPAQLEPPAQVEEVARGSLSSFSRRFLGDGFCLPHGRRQTIFTVACDLKARAWDQGEAEAAIMGRARQLGLSPDELMDVPRQIRNAFSKERQPLDGPAEEATPVVDDTPPVGILDLIGRNPKMRRPIVHDLLRSGETMNIIAAPKTGKSWMVLDLALSVATGRVWLNRFKVERSRILLIDNELHEETLAERIQRVAGAMGIALAELEGWLEVKSLRGCLQSFQSLGSGLFKDMPAGKFGMVVFDAFYRFNIGDGADENDNASMAATYNLLDAMAKRLDACLVCIHHTSKGNQSEKSVTDVGAGAGSMSRAADTHLVLREHEQAGHLVIDAACRSWPPLEPTVVRFEYPRFYPEPNADAGALKKAKKKGDGWSERRFVEEFFPTPATEWSHKELVAAGAEAGLSANRVRTLRESACAKTPSRKPLLERVGDSSSSKYRRAS